MKLVAYLLLQVLCVADASGGKRLQVTVDGRRVLIYKPLRKTSLRSPQPKKVPGIMVLHGSYRIPEDMFGVGFETLAEEHDFLVIYPSTPDEWGFEWGYGSDIPFFSKLSDRLTMDDIGLDEKQLYVCGFSAGGSMSLFLQNEMDIFQGAGAVESGVGHVLDWNMSRSGHRTMLVWNHNDPVLQEFAPVGGEPAYFNATIGMLRRSASTQPAASRGALETSQAVPHVELLSFPEEGNIPELQVLSWRSEPGVHLWPSWAWTHSFDAAQELANFFFSSRKTIKFV